MAKVSQNARLINGVYCRPDGAGVRTELKYGQLTVLGDQFRTNGTWYVVCECECGRVICAAAPKVGAGLTKTCGCMRADRMRATMTKHGGTKNGVVPRLYKVWARLRYRCNVESDRAYKWYGARGITVCREWDESFEAFREWANASGYSPELTIDRIDNDRGYEPNNCRWVTNYEQCRNYRRNRLATIYGKTLCVADWSKISGTLSSTILHRLNRGWTDKEAVFGVAS